MLQKQLKDQEVEAMIVDDEKDLLDINKSFDII